MAVTLPADVAAAVVVLRDARDALTHQLALGRGGWPVFPDDVAAPTPRVIATVAGAGARPVEHRVLAWPEAEYWRWYAAWDILVTYAGWSGARARWPLGAYDDTTSGILRLPALVAAQAVLMTSLLAVEAPTWIPEVKRSAIAAVVTFAAGAAAAAYVLWRRRAS